MAEQLSMLPQLDAALAPVEHDVAANVRAHDPVTSFVAARMAREFAQAQCDRILAVLKAHGPLSKDQIAARLRLEGHAIGKRLPDLQKRGLAVPTDEIRKSAANRPERVWRAL